MLSYKRLNIDVLYDTISNDLIEEFYTPILTNSITYDRVSCYFSLDTLLLLSKPLGLLLKNDGVARFIMSVEMSSKDYKFYSDVFNSEITRSVEDEVDKLINDRDRIPIDLSNLGYLLKKGKIQIKIAQKEEGLFHEKFAICKDNYGNEIGFIGSLNETVYGMKKNSESITTRKSYSGSLDDARFLELKKNKFSSLWNNNVKGHHVIDLPDAIKKKIIKVSNENYKNTYCCKTRDFIYVKFDERKRLKIECNTGFFTKTSRFYNKKIKPLISEFYEGYIILKEIDNYVLIKKTIGKIRDYCELLGVKLIIGSDLKEYLAKNDIFIERRRELGTFIKNKDEMIIPAFSDFKKNLDNSLKRSLKESQLWDAFHCSQMIKSSNYSVPGTGKTAMVLGAFYYLKKMNEVKKMIVCGPLNSRKSWRDEIEFVFQSSDKPRFIDIKSFNKSEASKNNFFRDEIEAYDIVFINHDALNSVYFQLKNYNKNEYFICIDEVHKFKGYKSKRFDLAYELFRNNRYKISLTGTPNPNGFQDFYSQLKIIYPNEYQFFFGYTYDELKAIGSDKNSIEKFNDLYQPFFCRTTKKDLKIKEPLPDNIIFVPMTKCEEEIYNDLRINLNRNKLLMYMRMIQLTTIPDRLDSKIPSDIFDYSTTDLEDFEGSLRKVSMTKLPSGVIDKAKNIKYSSKILHVKKLVREIISKKRNVIIWAIFVDTHQKIKSELTSMGIKAEIINGKIDLDEREVLLEQFKSKKFRVLIANPHTMAESVSLHKDCHDAIYVEYDFNLTHNLQSRDRIHRLGVPENVETRYHYLVSVFEDGRTETADQYIYRRLNEKREQMLSIVESELIDTVQVDDIYELLNLIV